MSRLHNLLRANFADDVAQAVVPAAAAGEVLACAAQAFAVLPNFVTAAVYHEAMHRFGLAVLGLRRCLADWEAFGFSLDDVSTADTPGRRHFDRLLAWARQHGGQVNSGALADLWRVIVEAAAV